MTSILLTGKIYDLKTKIILTDFFLFSKNTFSVVQGSSTAFEIGNRHVICSSISYLLINSNNGKK